MNKFMKTAVKEATKGIRSLDGGPFGAVIVKNGKIIAKAHNSVLKNNDPSAHAEINAIRKAGKKLGRFKMEDCEIYSSCQPCPMCLGAIYWAGINKIYYGCYEKDAADIGFKDLAIHEIIKGNSGNEIKMECIDRQECLVPFKEWAGKIDKKMY